MYDSSHLQLNKSTKSKYIYVNASQFFKENFYYGKKSRDGLITLQVKSYLARCERYEYFFLFGHADFREIDKSDRIFIKSISDNIHAEIISKL